MLQQPLLQALPSLARGKQSGPAGAGPRRVSAEFFVPPSRNNDREVGDPSTAGAASPYQGGGRRLPAGHLNECAAIFRQLKVSGASAASSRAAFLAINLVIFIIVGTVKLGSFVFKKLKSWFLGREGFAKRRYLEICEKQGKSCAYDFCGKYSPSFFFRKKAVRVSQRLACRKE